VAGWRIGNVCIFMEEENFWWVLGEVTNETGSSQEEIEVQVTFFAADGSSVASDFDYVLVDAMPAGATLPVDIVVESAVPPAEYEFDINSTASETTVRDDLQVINTQLTYVGDDLLVIGQAHNPGPDLADYAELITTLYNKQGAVIAVGYEFLNAEELRASEWAPFEILTEGLHYLRPDYVPADHVVIALGF